ncbi:MAG: hypothetical protein U0457_18475 [Candidatus Sericytochromatia bacterium]
MVNQINRTSSVNVASNDNTLRPLNEIMQTNNVKPRAASYQGESLQGGLSGLTQLGVGALSGYKYQGNFVGATDKLIGSIKTGGISDVANGFKDFGTTVGHDAYNAAGVGAMLSGGLSAVSNTLGVVNGSKTLGQAGANVFTDTVKGAVSGIGGLAVGGTSAFLLGAFGLAGTPVIVASVVGGAVGASLANKMLGTENLRARLGGY